MEEVNVGGKKQQEMELLMPSVLCYISYAKVSQILAVLWDFHHLFGSRNSPTTGILHTICHFYGWPTREAKPRFGATFKRSAHDCQTHLYIRVTDYTLPMGHIYNSVLFLFCFTGRLFLTGYFGPANIICTSTFENV